MKRPIIYLILILLVFSLFAYPKLKYFLWNCDEGFFTSPAYSLISNGTLASFTFPPGGCYIRFTDSYLLRIDQRTYWQPPVHFLLLALYFKLLGVGYIAARLLSFSFGILGLIFAYLLARQFLSPLSFGWR